MFSFRRKSDDRPVILIISGACCMPGMAPFDVQAKKMIEQAMVETGVNAELKVVPATNAMFGGIPRKIMTELFTMFNQSSKVGLPAVLINGEVTSYGVPKIEELKAALNKFAANKPKEE